MERIEQMDKRLDVLWTTVFDEVASKSASREREQHLLTMLCKAAQTCLESITAVREMQAGILEYLAAIEGADDDANA